MSELNNDNDELGPPPLGPPAMLRRQNATDNRQLYIVDQENRLRLDPTRVVLTNAQYNYIPVFTNGKIVYYKQGKDAMGNPIGLEGSLLSDHKEITDGENYTVELRTIENPQNSQKYLKYRNKYFKYKIKYLKMKNEMNI